MNRIKPGEIKTIVFAPKRAGRFKLICGEFCGPGHAGMVGTVIVVEPHRRHGAVTNEKDARRAISLRRTFPA